MVEKGTRLNYELACEWFDVNLDTGELFWKQSPSKKCPVGKKVGNLKPSGYVKFGFLGRYYHNHRVVFLLGEGRWPHNQIDHINEIKSDNRFVNLRDVRPHENNSRRPKFKKNKTGYIGVKKVGDKYRAQIHHLKVRYDLGLFTDPKEAAIARDKKAFELHGIFARFNFPELFS